MAFQGGLRQPRRSFYQQEVELFLWLLVPAVGMFAACSRTPQLIVRSTRGPVTIKVEIADTPDARAHGLMYRQDLAADAGMLFIFPTESEQRFWMKNTPLPLDMVFIGSDRRIVGIVPDTRPFTTNPLGVAALSQYVLEVHAGFCAKHGLSAGDAVEFVRIPNSAE